MEEIFAWRKGKLEPVRSELPQEYPLRLAVNGREIATLVASPHDLRYLVAGFLRHQGLAESLADIPVLSVCQESGIASVQLKNPLPEHLGTVLTTGCGAGVSFRVPVARRLKTAITAQGGFTPDGVFAAMDALAEEARGYKRHGGMHSSALATAEGRLILYAEDIGRHNTIDRLAGEAMFKGVATRGAMLISTGRISSEMAAKAVLLGVPLIASRTSPTDMARDICAAAGIALVGYVRGKTFILYTHCNRLNSSSEA